jgi:hypothetical protein
MKLIADNYKPRQSSCYFLDMRNSTFITRAISLSHNIKSGKAVDRLKIHADFMLKIHRQVSNKLMKLDKDKYYFDDTGDGHFCLLWTKAHTWDALDIACTVSKFLSEELKIYNAGELDLWSKETNEKLKLDFGIGLHTGGSLVYEDENSGKRYAFGIVLNTAARLESFTKNYSNLSLLFTGNFKNHLTGQRGLFRDNDKRRGIEWLEKIKPASLLNIDIKDGKTDGHELFTILPEDISDFITNE